MAKLVKGSVVRSPVTGRRYRIGRVIGHGGYGKAFEAVDLTHRARVCLKYTLDQMSWHRESYFGELLRDQRRVIQMYDSFPVVPGKSGRGKIRYCLVLELAEHGAVADYLARTEKPWSEKRATREVMALLKLLDQLHGGSATHRDITPFNIFVCKNGVLKMGDFGIARHALAGRSTKPDAFNPDYVTRGFLDAEHRAWTAVDDVYQMGQLLAMLLFGQLRDRVRVRDLRELDVSPELKAVIKRAIGPRSRRYADAWEMLQALRGDGPPPTLRLKSLRDKTVLFSGPLSLSRFDAELLAAEAGARVVDRVTKDLDVLVQGRRRRSREGTRPSKLVQAERLHKQGHPIHIIGESDFRRLVRAD